MFGCTLVRDNESIEAFNELGTLLEEYHKYNILKFYGLTYLDYLNITLVEKHALIASSIDEMRRQNAALQQQQQEYAKAAANAEQKGHYGGNK